MTRALSRSFVAGFVGVAVLATAGIARAATASWNPPGGNRDWSNAANWSTGAVPGPADDVVADGSVTNDRIDVDVSIDVQSITTQNGYSRNISWSAGSSNSIRVRGNVTLNGSGDFECSSGSTQIAGNVIVAGGRFLGVDALLVIDGNVALSSGTFRNSGTTTRIGGAFTRTGGTYSTNQGLVLFTSKTNRTHTFGGAVFRRAIFNDGMVGYWNLDQNGGATVTDLSGFDNTGTHTNMSWATASPPSLTFTDVSYGTFNGTSSRVALTVSQLPAANAAQSIAAWVNINALPGGASSIVSLNGTSSTVRLGLGPTHLSVLRNDGAALVTTTAPSTGTWHHVAYTWDGTANWLYVDGVAVAATVTAHDTAAVTSGFIGATSAGAGFFNGSIDEVRIYDRALTALQVSSMALGQMPATTIAQHTFSDAYTATVGTNIADLVIASGTVTGPGAISIEGSWLNYGGQYTGYGNVTLTSNAAEGILSGGSGFVSLNINRGGANYTLRDRLSIPNGTFTLSSGRIQLGAHTMYVGRLALAGGTTFTVGTGTVILNSSTDHTLPSSVLTSYYRLRLEDATEANLVGYWKLDEGTNAWTRDWSGSGNTGTLPASGLGWTSPAAAISFDNPAAVDFRGSGYVSVGTTSLPSANAAQTIAAWVNITALPGAASSIVALTGASSAVKLGLSATNLRVLRNDGTALIQTTAPSTGVWHHVAYTWDGSSNVLYVDGVAVSPTATAHDGAAVTGAFIGASSAAADFFNGKIDDVRVYNTALTATQIARLAAGRYAGTGGLATAALGANTTVTNTFALDSANLSSGAFTFNHSLTTAAAAINGGTYTVGSAAQQFQGGLTVQNGGVLAMATSGGSVQIATGMTLTMDGTLNASNTGAVIRSVSGTYGFSVGSTASARPTLNITGLTVQNTNASGMRINVNPAAVTTFTRFDNLVFLSGTTTYLNIYATSLYLTSSGSRFGITTGGVSDGALPTNNVVLTGNGIADGETRIVFGTATCAAAQTTLTGYCQDAWASDDDPDNNGVGNTPATNGAVVQYVRTAATDTAGNIEGFPTSAFDWNTFAFYSTYVAYHDASGTADRIYVRDSAGVAKYQWDTPSGETIIGTPRWITSGTTHYLFVALTSGKVYRLTDTGAALVTDATWGGAVNPFDCTCTIVTALTMDSSNIYFGGTRPGPLQRIWKIGLPAHAEPMGAPFPITPVLTAATPGSWSNGSTTYLFFGTVGNIIKFNATTHLVEATNTNPGSAAIRGRVLPTLHDRVFAGDDAGRMWAIDANNFGGTAMLWSYAVAGGDPIQSAPYYDYTGQILMFGTDGGKVVALNSSGAALTGYPIVPGSASDSIRTALLYGSGILVAGSTTGKLFFLDRSNGTTGPALIRQYYFGPTEAVSGIGYDSNTSRYMVSTADPTTNNGRLYYIDAITDPTAGTL